METLIGLLEVSSEDGDMPPSYRARKDPRQVMIKSLAARKSAAETSRSSRRMFHPARPELTEVLTVELAAMKDESSRIKTSIANRAEDSSDN
jgi:hypothetical protein